MTGAGPKDHRRPSAARAFAPAASCPGPPDQTPHGDDRVGEDDCFGEVEEGIKDSDATPVTPGEAMKDVLPRVSAFDVPTPTRLDARLLPLVRDTSVQAPFAEQSPSGVRVVVGVQVHSDVGQRATGRGSPDGPGSGRAAESRGGWHRPGHCPAECCIHPSCPSASVPVCRGRLVSVRRVLVRRHRARRPTGRCRRFRSRGPGAAWGHNCQGRGLPPTARPAPSTRHMKPRAVARRS